MLYFIVKLVVKFVVYGLVVGTIVFLSKNKSLYSNPRARCVLILLAVMLPFAQALNQSRLTYPFAAWGMYAASSPPNFYNEYLVISNNGDTIHYPFNLVVFSSPRAFSSKLGRLVTDCACNEGDPLIDDFMAGLEQIYRKSTGNTYDKMEINRVVFEPGNRNGLIREKIYEWQNK